MTRQFISLTQDEIDEKVAENLHSRESELMSYDFEQANHEAAIVTLGALAWDDTILKYKGLSRDAMIVRALADGLDTAAIQKVSDLNTLEFHKMNLEAVKTEIAKSERHYDGLKSALPAGLRRDAAMAAAKAKRDAPK